jgi:CarD family transcriptional regulator
VALALPLLERDGEGEDDDEGDDQNEHRLRDLLLTEIGGLGGPGDGGHEKRQERGKTEGAKHPIHAGNDSAEAARRGRLLTNETIAKLRYDARPSDGGEEPCLASAATFEVGEVMVFGSEGFARVEAVGEKEALGRTQVFLDLFVFDANMRVSVPVERALERGLRPIASSDEIENVLDSLQEARWTSIPWNRDGRLVKERYAEGGLEAILDTLGSLVELAGTKKLNDAQRTLLDRARRALVLETSAALGVEEDEASERVDGLLGAAA